MIKAPEENNQEVPYLAKASANLFVDQYICRKCAWSEAAKTLILLRWNWNFQGPLFFMKAHDTTLNKSLSTTKKLVEKFEKLRDSPKLRPHLIL